MRSVDVRDLLGRPYRRGVFDCSTVAQIVLQRAGIAPAFPAGEDALYAWIGGERSPWRRMGVSVDDATNLGDVVLTDSTGAPAGVWTLQDAAWPRVFATALPERGFTLAKARAIVGVRAVYRWVGVTDGAPLRSRAAA